MEILENMTNGENTDLKLENGLKFTNRVLLHVPIKGACPGFPHLHVLFDRLRYGWWMTALVETCHVVFGPPVQILQ